MPACGSPAVGQAAAVLLLVLAAALPVAAQSGSTKAQIRDQLLAFKASFENGDAVLPYFNASTDPCTWQNEPPDDWTQGVTCDGSGQVTRIIIQGQYHSELLCGTIPAGGWDLPSPLGILDLSGNALSGTLPAGWKLPDSMYELDLYNNKLTGTLPTDFQLPDIMQKVLLNGNSLRGSLPTFPGREALNVSVSPGNPGLCGQVPTSPHYISWAWLNQVGPPQVTSDCQTAQLLALKASFTNGDSQLPTWTASSDPCSGWDGIKCGDYSRTVTEINVTSRGLEGSVPPNGGWELPDSLALLDLSNNNITGTVPSRLPSSLRTINLSYNKLTGGLPASENLPQGLLTLFLNDNPGLGGTIPANWSLPPTLTGLNIWTTGITGAVPDNWTLPAGLVLLALGRNNLTQLPTTWVLPDTIRFLYLDNNPEMGGTLPGAGWKLGNKLEVLTFDGNAMTGNIDPALVLPPTIQQLFLRNNNLSGPLPSWPSLDATTKLVAELLPGNSGLCGPVPAAAQSKYYNVERKSYVSTLPPCGVPPPPPPPPAPAPPPAPPLYASPTVNIAIGAIVGGVVGAVVAVAAGAAFFVMRRRRRRAASSRGNIAPGHDPEAPPGDPDAADTMLSKRAVDLWSLDGLKTYQEHQKSILPSELSDLDDSAWSAIKATGGSGGTALPEGEASSTNTASEVTAVAALPRRVDMKPWAVDFSAIDLIRIAGEGSAGRVFQGVWNQVPVAVKVLFLSGLDSGSGDLALSLSNPLLAGLQAEASTMASLRHPCCVNFLGVCTSPPCVVTEFCSRGSLSDVLRAGRRDPAVAEQLTWGRRLGMAVEAASGMLYLHSRSPPVLHRDLKAPNLMIDGDWHCKVGDFNLSKALEETQLQMQSSAVASNPRWIAPEVMHGERASFASDVYAFGIVMWELLTWQLPWSTGTMNPFQIYREVCDGRRPPVPECPSQLPGGTFPGMPAYLALMQRCWTQEAGDRPTFGEVVAELRELAAAEQ